MKNSEKKLMFGLLFAIMMDTTGEVRFGIVYGVISVIYLISSVVSAAKGN